MARLSDKSDEFSIRSIFSSTDEILHILKVKKGELEKKYPISELGLFGSYARGDYNEDSDIDILVDFNDSIDGFDYIRIAS